MMSPATPEGIEQAARVGPESSRAEPASARRTDQERNEALNFKLSARRSFPLTHIVVHKSAQPLACRQAETGSGDNKHECAQCSFVGFLAALGPLKPVGGDQCGVKLCAIGRVLVQALQAFA